MKMMNTRKLGIMLMAAVLIVTLAFAGAASADTVTVTTEKDLRNNLASGNNVILGSDISIGSELHIDKTVTLDLAGHELRGSGNHRLIYIASSGNLTMNDSSPGAKGKITHGHKGKNGGGVFVDGTFILEGGSIEDCSVGGSGEKTTDGGGVYLDEHSTFIMNGGAIKNCRSDFYGGGMTINDATFTMNGGTISGCIVHHESMFGTENGYDGGGIYINDRGTFTMNGGTIENCVTDDHGGGVCVSSGTFTMNDGAIKNCKVRTSLGEPQDEGGGVYLENTDCTFTMNGGIISGCYAEDYGGGVFVDDGATFNLNGGIITGCSVDDNYGGGVYVDDASPGFRDGMIYISGNPIVFGNKKGNSPNNVYLEDDDLLELAGDFTGCIGISNQDGKFGANNGHKGGEFFFKDGPDYKGRNDGGNLKFDGYVPEFKDITPETTGLVKSSGSLTDTSKPYTVSAGQTIRMMTPIVIGAGTAENPVTVQIDGTLLSAKQWPVITVENGKYLKLTGNGRLSDGWSIGYDGGGVNLREGSRLTLDGVTISNNVADKNGGGIGGDKDTSIVINSGKIENNKAGENGGGISSQGVLVLMGGGEIKGNTAGKNGGGMHISRNTVFNMGDSATVIENKKGDTTDNVYLETSEILTLIGSLAGTVGISYAGGIPAAGNQFGFAPSASSSGAENIKADGSDLVGSISDRKLVWSAPKPSITVTFDVQGKGSVTPATKQVYVGEPYGKLPTPASTDYRFAGWFTDEQCTSGKEVTKDTIVPQGLGSSQTLYAKWLGPIVTVTFDAKGGDVSPTSKQVLFGENYGTLPTPTHSDPTKVFSGWFTDEQYTPGNEVTSKTKVTKDTNHSLYAKWTDHEITVTFDPQGGSVTPTSRTVYYNQPYGNLPTPTPTLESFDFQGWYLDKEGSPGKQVTKDTIVTATKDHTLYAKWFGPIAISNIHVDFGTKSKTESKTVGSMEDTIYTSLESDVNLTFPADGNFTFKHGEVSLVGEVTIPKNTDYTFTITPKKDDIGFYSAEIPVKFTNGGTTTTYGNISVTYSIIADGIKEDTKSAVPELPTVYALAGAKSKDAYAYVIGVEGSGNLKVENRKADISLSTANEADKTHLYITDVSSPESKEYSNAVILGADSQITAEYPVKSLQDMNKESRGTYAVKLALNDVSINLPSLTGEFKDDIVSKIMSRGYIPVSMISTVNDAAALEAMNGLIMDNGVGLTFTVPTIEIPASAKDSILVFHVDDAGNVEELKTHWKTEGDNYIITADGSSFSNYVVAFNILSGYHSIETNAIHGDIYTYLYAQAGETVPIMAIPKKGYEYYGLLVYGESSQNIKDFTFETTFEMPDEDVSLYGLFANKVYTVTFEMNGHGAQIPDEYVAPGETVPRPEDPVDEGYVFGGWFSDSALTTPYDFDTRVTDDLTLYAKWTEVSGSHRGHSASIPKDYTPSSSVPVMVQETAKPTTAPTLAAPTAMPTTKPTTQATQKSPAPFVGLVAGLGAAALVLARMRR